HRAAHAPPLNLARAIKDCGVHLRSAPHTDDLVHRRWIEGGGARHERHVSAPARGVAAHRQPHPRARSVPDITDRLEILIGRPGSDEAPLPWERSLRSEYGFGRG